jgi:predicted NAD-dependent protein-ADP-ribosyltransferase YbiA (DUF1768 family)
MESLLRRRSTMSQQSDPEMVSHLPDGSRVIRKPDGHVITIAPTGETVIQRPNGVRITQRPDGAIQTETPDGRTSEHRSKKLTPPNERPLNVSSGTQEAIGKLMSNFAHTPFTLDGRKYASVEGFYVSLKFLEPEERAAVAQLHGREARAAGRSSTLVHTSYEGDEFELGSEAHHALVKRAIRAKLAQHPEIAEAFVATHPRPLVHRTGRPEPRNTKLPGVVFCRILSELREELVAARRKDG